MANAKKKTSASSEAPPADEKKDEKKPEEKKKPTAPPVPAVPERVRGPASLSLLAASAPSWNLAAGEATILELTLTSNGGPVPSGVYVEVGGPGLPFVAAKDVTVGTEKGTFEVKGPVARADLKAIKIDAGYPPPEKVKGKPVDSLPNPKLAVKIALSGAKAGQGLLTVRVGPITSAGGTAGSAMQGKTVIVG